MQALTDLRQAARDRRDKIIAKARTEYEAIIGKIASIEQDLLGREPSNSHSIASCVESVIPTDGPFTSGDLLRSLEALDRRRPWRKRSVDHAISRLRAKGLVRRLAKAKAGRAENVSPALYVRTGVRVESQPFGDKSLLDVLYETLQGQSLTATELTVAILEAGYRSTMTHKRLRDHAARIMRKDGRFRALGDRWEASTVGGQRR